MAVDAEHPGNVARDLGLELLQGVGELVELRRGLRLEVGGAGVEQHVGGEDEAVADHLELGTGAEHLAQLAEEVGAIARKLLHLLGERHVQALAEIGDLDLAVAVLGLGGVERLLQRRELGA